MSIPERTYDILLEGTPSVDLTFCFANLDSLPALGQEVVAQGFAMNAGSSFNTAASLARFGLRVGLLCRLGNDFFSRFVAEQMQGCGLPLDLVSWVDHPTPIVSVGVSLPHDRLFLTYDATEHSDLPKLCITTEHLDRFRPRALITHGELDLEVCAEARNRGAIVLLDAYWDSAHLRSDRWREYARHVDIFSPNLPEALEITETNAAEEALRVLGRLCRRVVIKAGAEGCIAQEDGRRFVVPAIPVEAVETTGAGDNFSAGLIYGLLQGHSFERSLAYANIAGGLSTLVLGGCGGNATAGDLERWMQECYGNG